MILQLDRIKEPTGIYDIKSIKINGESHFAASFGATVRIYHATSEIHSFSVPFCIFYIFPYQEWYFLIGRRRYMVYKGFRKVAEHVLDHEFNKIDKILALKNFIIIFYEGRHYVLGKIKNMKIELGETLDDGQFFNVLGSEEVNGKIIILAKTFTKVYLLTYTAENNRHRVVKGEIQSGLALARHTGDSILIFDKVGLWAYNTQLSFIKEFANYRVVCAVFEEENRRTLLFCRDGEVIGINADLTHCTLGFLDVLPLSVVRINDLYFCGSTTGSCFITISEKLTVVKSISCSDGDADPYSRLLLRLHSQSDQLSPVADDGANQRPKHTNHVDVEPINYKISNISELQKGSRFLGYFKCKYFTIFSFEDFSIINNCRFEPVINASANLIFTTKRILHFSSTITQYNIDCKHVKIYHDLALIYSFKRLYTFDLTTHVVLSRPASFGFCDFILRDSSVICIDFNEKVHIVECSSFKEVPIGRQYISHEALFNEQYECLGDEGSIHCTSGYLSDCSSGYSKPVLVANGKIFTLIKDKPYSLFNAESHIQSYSCFNNQLILSCRNTVIFNCTTAKIAYCNVESTNSFMVGEDVFLCLPSGAVERLEPPVLKENLSNDKFRGHCSDMTLETGIDQKTVKFTLDGHSLEFGDCFQKFSCVIRSHLVCAGLISTTAEKNKIVFISTRRRKPKIRKSIDIDAIPLCVTSYNNNVCVVTSESIMLLALRYGKIKTVKKIKNVHCPCRDVQLYNEGIVLVTTFDWFYLIVNLKMNMIKKIQTDSFSIPFMINSVNGHAIKNILYYQGATIDCIEDVAYVLSHENTILVLTESGSVLAVQIIQSDAFKFIYDSAPKVVSNLVN